MISEKDLEHIIYNTVDIVPKGEDSVFLGTFSIVDNPTTLGAVLSYVTGMYDAILQSLPLAAVHRIELQTQRCFTYEEYSCLFKPIKDFSLPPVVFKTLLIPTEAERLLFIRNRKRDESYEAFVALLHDWSKIHNPLLYSFLYGIHN